MLRLNKKIVLSFHFSHETGERDLFFFVAAGAISMNTFGQYAQSFFLFSRFDLFCDQIFMGGVSNKTISHITRVLDLTYCSMSQRSKLKKMYESWRILLLFDLECSNLV
jgi:hypothetical protein